MPVEQEPISAPEFEETQASQDTEPEATTDELTSSPDDPAPTGDDTAEPDVQPESDDDSEEFDWNGKKVRGPKGLKDSVLMHADYTRKTQEVAADRQAIKQQHEQLQQWYQQADEELGVRADLKAIDRELEQFNAVDWSKWESDDVFQAQAGWRRFQQLKEQRGEAQRYLEQRQYERSEQAKQETENRLQETRDYAEKNIKGWSPEVDAKLTEFATSELGFDRNTLRAAYNPAIYRALHLAWVGHQALQKQPAKPAQPKAEPLKTVTAKSSPPTRKSYADMEMDEYAKARGYA